MGVIVDQKLQREVDDLEAKGQFSLAGAFRAANQVSIESLAFLANVPAQYQVLVANSVAFQAAHPARQEAREKKERERRGMERAMLDALRRQEIDNHKVTLTIGGKDIEITQAELRRAMSDRVEALREERELHARSGNFAEVARIDNLVGRYEPNIERLETEEVDEEVMQEVQALVDDDPEFAARLTAQVAPAASAPKRSSYAAEVFGSGGIDAPSLKQAFARGASPDATPTAVPALPEPDQRARAAKAGLESLGF